MFAFIPITTYVRLLAHYFIMQINSELVLGITAGFIGSFLYAVSVVVYRSQSDEVNPITVNLVKMWVALSLISAIILLPLGYSPFSISFEIVSLLILSVIFNVILADLLYLFSQNRIGVSYAFPLAGLYPILTYILTVLFLAEQFLLTRLFGTVLAVSGIVLLSRGKAESDETNNGHIDVVGVGMALLASFFYAIGHVVLQLGVTDVDPIEGSFIRILFGSMLLVPIFIIAHQREMQTPSKRAIKLVALAGLFGMGIGSIMYVTSIKYLGAAVSSVITSTSSLFALTLSVIFLKENVNKLAILGVFSIVFGVMLVVLGL